MELTRKKIFIAVLLREIKFVKRSRYRVRNTKAKRACDLPEIPAHDLVFQILRRRMMIAAKWLTSPASRKMFIAKSVDGQRITISKLNFQNLRSKPPMSPISKSGRGRHR